MGGTDEFRLIDHGRDDVLGAPHRLEELPPAQFLMIRRWLRLEGRHGSHGAGEGGPQRGTDFRCVWLSARDLKLHFYFLRQTEIMSNVVVMSASSFSLRGALLTTRNRHRAGAIEREKSADE